MSAKVPGMRCDSCGREEVGSYDTLTKKGWAQRTRVKHGRTLTSTACPIPRELLDPEAGVR